MSGHISGVQKLIIDKNPKSVFTNWDNHNLNLCGAYASHEEAELATFFAAVECLWTFFSRSTLRWTTRNKKAKPDGMHEQMLLQCYTKSILN